MMKNKKQIIYFPSEEFLDKVKEHASKYGLSLSSYIRMALTERMDSECNSMNTKRKP